MFLWIYGLIISGLIIKISGQQQNATITLNQGVIIGLKIFPESSRTAVYSYLGIPYAQPPVGKLRFTPPLPHNGWNRTLYARNFQSICPQLQNNIYEESGNGFIYTNLNLNENCLFLNVWTPETALRFGTIAPVLIIISGEEQAFDWSRNRPTGLDLAAEGVVVVTVQSRMNILGWLTTETLAAPGNLGLLDQQLAMQWVQTNIPKFGGDPERVTLLGHGTSGATNAMIHWLSPKTSIKLFSKLILMSGSALSSWAAQQTSSRIRSNSASVKVIRNLACDSSNPAFTLRCLQHKSLSDLMRAFGNIYKNGNYTTMFGPEIDLYLEKTKQFLPSSPRQLLQQKSYHDIPIIIGICNNEGAFIQDQWIELAREDYSKLNNHIHSTILPNILHHYGFRSSGVDQIKETINWRFFDQIPKTIPYLLNALQRLLSETKFEKPFYETLKILASETISSLSFMSNNILRGITSYQRQTSQDGNNIGDKMEHRIIAEESQPSMSPINQAIPPTSVTTNNKAPLFVYSFQQSNAMDLRGRINYFGGASHTSDLLFLMGPSLFQQIGRRKMSQSEEKLCQKMRKYYTDFIKTGTPTPGRLFDAWHPYTQKQKFIQILGGSNLSPDNPDGISIMEKNRDKIMEMVMTTSATLLSETPALTNGLNVNPYNLGSGDNTRNGFQENSRASKNYLPNSGDSEYYLEIGRIYAFWNDLLPKIQSQQTALDSVRQDISYLDGIDITSAKYRHAFFSMLILVCILLAILCVCVYILKKNHHHGFNVGYL